MDRGPGPGGCRRLREALPAVGPGCVGAAGRWAGWFLLSEKKTRGEERQVELLNFN